MELGLWTTLKKGVGYVGYVGREISGRRSYHLNDRKEIMLCRVGGDAVVMIFTNGRTWSSGIHGSDSENAVTRVNDSSSITLSEFKKILGDDAEHWEAIYKTKH